MNKRQKEILQSQLDSEERTLKKLKGIYKKALDDVNDQIAALMGRKDTESLQSIIYQVEYQKALKTQINGILDALNGEQFTTISDYLTKCYEDGFIGTMYDLHGQGIPLVFPIDQDQVIRAIQHDTKLSKPLYKRLGEDSTILKRHIAGSISRGIAQGSSYADIARSITSGMVGDYSKILRGGALGKAYTIARTEGHRITSEATFDAQKKAKNEGADIVKQWDAALDKRTRPHHVQLDGQIRDIDEPFEVSGRKAMYPGDFGVASEDIHCRCAILQRVRTALDEDELDELKKRAEYFGLDKSKNFEDFKAAYQNMAEKNQNINDTVNEMLTKAQAAELTITKDLKEIVETTHGNINYEVNIDGEIKHSLDFRFKSKSSLKRKITTDFDEGKSLDTIKTEMYDVVRYTDLVDKNLLTSDYIDIQKALEAKGYKITRVKNTLGNSGAAYRGLNTIVTAPDGYNFEVQFHTPESIEIKERIHKLYELQREDGVTLEEWLRLDKEMKKISSALPDIKNVDLIKNFNTFKGESPVKVVIKHK